MKKKPTSEQHEDFTSSNKQGTYVNTVGVIGIMVYILLGLLILLAICAIGYITWLMVRNQGLSLQLIKDAASVAVSSENSEVHINQITKLMEIYKSSMGVESVSFLYNLITSVLIGVASGVVMKILDDYRKLHGKISLIKEEAGKTNTLVRKNKGALDRALHEIECSSKANQLLYHLQKAVLISTSVELLSYISDKHKIQLQYTPKLPPHLYNVTKLLKDDSTLHLTYDDKLEALKMIDDIQQQIDKAHKASPTVVTELYRDTISEMTEYCYKKLELK